MEILQLYSNFSTKKTGTTCFEALYIYGLMRAIYMLIAETLTTPTISRACANGALSLGKNTRILYTEVREMLVFLSTQGSVGNIRSEILVT